MRNAFTVIKLEQKRKNLLCFRWMIMKIVVPLTKHFYSNNDLNKNNMKDTENN